MKVFALGAITLIVLVGCNQQPDSLFDCQMIAAKSPTDMGVRVAYEACLDKFPVKAVEMK